jgi:5-(carboxyamino)imidazole ribonucleotide synthase
MRFGLDDRIIEQLQAVFRRYGEVEMRNLIGEEANRWRDILGDSGAALPLYGKHEARPGRKMGHVTRIVGR